MSLNDNPIFLTQKRLVHRGGVLAAILIAALVGLSLLSGLIAYLAAPLKLDFSSAQDAGKVFYGWTIGVEILVLVIGGASRISTALMNERKAGLWDSNRLTPLSPWQLVTGYWFGSPLREAYMAVVLAGIGLVIVLLGRLSPVLWLGTQLLIFSTALFFGLLAVLGSLVAQRTQSAFLVVILFVFLQLPSLSMPNLLLTNFLLPTHSIGHFFSGTDYSGNAEFERGWYNSPEIFGARVPSILLTLALQTAIGIFLWRAAIRKTANPFQPLMLRWEAVAVFGILLLVQNGLIWGLWRGQFPANAPGFDDMPMLAIVHGGAMLVAIIILGVASLQPESVRVNAMRRGIKNLTGIFPGSAVSLALLLAAVAAAALLPQFMFSFGSSWEIYLVAVGNLLAFFLIFSLLLEFCRLRFRRRGLGFVALWLFILCVLPLILAGVFSSADVAKLSLLSPGAFALGDPEDANLNQLLAVVAGHLGIAALLFVGWRQQWKELLARASAVQN